jgi:hypothetical protein
VLRVSKASRCANWEDKAPSHEANTEYQRRQHWLERIKNELAALRLEGKRKLACARARSKENAVFGVPVEPSMIG